MIWLDEFTQYVGGAARLHLGAKQAIARMTDFEVMRQLTSEAAARAIAAAKINRRASDEDEHLTSLALFFTSPGEIALETYACAVGRDLALAFEGARATEDVGRRAMAFSARPLGDFSSRQ